ncbi:hypothetical protein TQ29_14465 [Actibacterium sp. EMB200-NS6]|nr:hypothetical protein TQ29_14465 [Actibacterium sp. EMB200-NS6]
MCPAADPSYNSLMPPKNTSRIEITKEQRDQLASEKVRTGLGASAIFLYARSIDLLSPQSKLKSHMIGNWISGHSTTAHEDGLSAILAAYTGITYEPMISKDAHPNQLLLIDDDLRHEMRSILSARSNSSRRLRLNDSAAPTDLTEYRLKQLVMGRDDTIRLSHLRYIRERMRSLTIPDGLRQPR